MDALDFAVVDPANEYAHQALQYYFEELGERFRDGFDLGVATSTGDELYRPPSGLFVVVLRLSELVGCGALHYLDDESAEIKRMWVSAASRGLGVGKRLLAYLETEAITSGHARIVLDTNARLVEAVAMYRSNGYQEIQPYNSNPHAEMWFEKHLGD